ncbi:MAG: HD domain-containing protein [Methanosarcinales archaeon]|jgi:HD superfamily phosphohydrolase|nr:HD domain-containing protein [Methanosarcinales archaeon]
MTRNVILDPIHGYIEFDELKSSLFDTPQMQRLRRIRQLGFSSLVYPGANHTRFEHSMGAMHLASLFQKIQRENKNSISDVSDYDSLDEIVAAALLHDIGHGPFSHATERLIEHYTRKSHDDVRQILTETEVGDVLKNHGFKPSRIAEHIAGKTPVSQILSSEIDVDKMDYLARDMHYTGVTSGSVDYIRLLNHLEYFESKLVLDAGAIRAAEGLLVSRYWMNVSVYYHHVSRISETMCSRACAYLLENKNLRPQELARMDDAGLMSVMRADDGFAGEISRRLDSRNLYKRALYTGVDSIGLNNIFEQRNRVSRIEKEIAENANVEPEDVIIDIPSKPAMAEMKALVMDGGMKKLTDASLFVKDLEHVQISNWKMGVFTPKEHLEAVSKAANDFFEIDMKPKMKQVSLTDLLGNE